MSDYLVHYGVKGMKWGVRRARKKQEKQARKYVKRMRKDWIDIHNSAADRNESKAIALNKKYEGVDFKKNKKAYRKYVDEYVSTWNNDLVSEVTRRYGDRPELVTEDIVRQNLPTYIWDSGAQAMYDSLYE